MFSFLRKLLIYGIVILGLVSVLNYWMARKSYLVDYRDIEVIAKRNLGMYVCIKDKDNKEGVSLLISLPLYVCNVCVCMIIIGQCSSGRMTLSVQVGMRVSVVVVVVSKYAWID